VGVGLADGLGAGLAAGPGVSLVVDATGVTVSLDAGAHAATAPAPAEPSSPKISERLRMVTILALEPVLSLRMARGHHHSA
jgi:hypothetical protein